MESFEEGDLTPLTLRQKVENKRFNRTLDRIVGALNALALGVLGYGVVKEALDAVAGDAFDPVLFAMSAVIGICIEIGIAYVTFVMTKRED